jgi:hypothetical protein
LILKQKFHKFFWRQLRCILRRDQYPDAEPNQILLSAQKKHDAFMDQLGR